MNDDNGLNDETLVEQAQALLTYLKSEPEQTIIPDGRVALLERTLAAEPQFTAGPVPGRIAVNSPEKNHYRTLKNMRHSRRRLNAAEAAALDYAMLLIAQKGWEKELGEAAAVKPE